MGDLAGASAILGRILPLGMDLVRFSSRRVIISRSGRLGNNDWRQCS